MFLRVAGAWLGPTPLRAADGKNGEFFGESVAVSDDTVVVGAPLGNARDDRGQTRMGAGAVYVFKRVGRSWQQQARLTARHASDDDGLGAAVAVYGDTLAASAPFEDSVKTGVNRNGRDDDALDSGSLRVRAPRRALDAASVPQGSTARSHRTAAMGRQPVRRRRLIGGTELGAVGRYAGHRRPAKTGCATRGPPIRSSATWSMRAPCTSSSVATTAGAKTRASCPSHRTPAATSA